MNAQQLSEKCCWETLTLEEALTSMERMSQPLSVQNLTYILHKCRTLKNIAHTKRLYAYMCKTGLDDHRSLGKYLVPMLVQVGSMCDAQRLFNKLVDRNVYCWTCLITGYIESGESWHALNLYQKMQEDSVYPDKCTFLAILKACARLKDAKEGQEIHADLARRGLERDIFVGSTLVDMYAKCGLLAEAREAFNKLPLRNEVSWNALMAGYAEHGLGEEALNCLKEMQLDGVFPNAVTVVCSLKACGSIGAIDKGREIHTQIVMEELERNLCVGSTLVDMYAKCGWLADAHAAFDMLPVRNEVVWTALMSAYAERGLGEEVLRCLTQMQVEGLSPDAVTFVCSLKACSSMGAVSKGQDIHIEIARNGLEKDHCLGNTLVDMYAKCGSLAEAYEAFDKLAGRDQVSWNALITGYVEHGFGEESLKCLKEMCLDGVSPNVVTFSCSLKACGDIGTIERGHEMHAEIARKGQERDPFVGNSLVNMYAKCGSPMEAQEVFDKLPVRDVVSWTALIPGYAEHELGEVGLDCLEQMQVEGLSPDAVMFSCSLKACGSIGAIDKGQEIHAEIARKGLERDIFVGSTLVDMYAKCGSLAEAQVAFYSLPVRNEVSWNAMMAGCAQLGEIEILFHMLERMRREGIKPDGITLSIVLATCSHTGLVDKGQKYFKAMSKDYAIIPGIKHYIGMVDLLCRAGQLDEAVEMMKKMPFCPNLMVWHTVLGACQKCCNVELGRLAFEHALQLDEKDAAAYILMSKIYADAHMHDEEKKIEAMRLREQT